LWTLASSARDAHNVAFASLPNSTVHVAVGWFRCTLEAAPVARGRLRELVRRFHKLIASGDRTSDAQADETAAEIGRALGLQPMLQSLPARVRRITIVPDDQLHAFPFAALPIGGGSYVVDRWAITIGVRRSIAAGKASPTATPITVASTSGGAALAPLPEADEQSRWLVEWWTARGCRPTQLQNEACTRARLLDTLGSSRVFHFSGHGSFDPDAPDKTGIVVSGEPNAGTVVNIARLAAVDCRGLRLATFFSCWSADSFLFPGHWAVSVPNTLCRAGARAIVAPLWEIEDRTSTALLRSIYGRLETTRVDEAVRQAQIETRSAGGRRRSPYFWAALQVYGDGARLDRKSFGGAAWPS
jgi:CHAT domain-containing protein